MLNPEFSTACLARTPNGDIATLSTSLSIGIVPSRDCRLVRRWSLGTECIWSCAASRPALSTLRLGAVRRLAYEAADCGLLSADLATGIRRVKGVKKLGVRLGNWLTAEQAQTLWQAPAQDKLKGKRDRALLALLLACGLRRHELAKLTLSHLQQREGHWAIVDLRGKGGRVRTIPVPDWVQGLVVDWTTAADI